MSSPDEKAERNELRSGSEPDLDSEGVYYISVEDFEWRPPKANEGTGGQKREAEHQSPPGSKDQEDPPPEGRSE